MFNKKIVDVSVSTNHAAFLIEGGYLISTGSNEYGQRGVGHCNPIAVPTMVTGIKDRFIKVIN